MPTLLSHLVIQEKEGNVQKKGYSLKCMGNPIQDMIEIRHQEMEEVETDHYERYGTISVSIGFDIAMACGVVWI